MDPTPLSIVLLLVCFSLAQGEPPSRRAMPGVRASGDVAPSPSSRCLSRAASRGGDPACARQPCPPPAPPPPAALQLPQPAHRPGGDGALYTTAPPELSATPPATATAAAPWSPRRLCARGAGGWRCRNWAGTVEWAPQEVVLPESEAALEAFLRSEAAAAAAAGAARRPLKVVGFAHSWSDIFAPAGSRDAAATAAAAGTSAGGASGAGVTLALHRLSGVTNLTPPPPGPEAHSAGTPLGYAEVLAGTTFAALFEELDAMGLALLVPPGGITGLTVGGAVSVGFHGSQVRGGQGGQGGTGGHPCLPSTRRLHSGIIPVTTPTTSGPPPQPPANSPTRSPARRRRRSPRSAAPAAVSPRCAWWTPTAPPTSYPRQPHPARCAPRASRSGCAAS